MFQLYSNQRNLMMKRSVVLFFCAILFPITLLAIPFGPTQQCETLWSVAVKNRPNKSVTYNQVMYAIVKANPNAFYGGNVNGLRPNLTLTIPSLAVMQQTPEKQAKQFIDQQSEIWPAQKQKLIDQGKMPVIDCGFLQQKKAVINLTAAKDAELESLKSKVNDLKQQLSSVQTQAATKAQQLTQQLTQQVKENQVLIQQQNKIAEASKQAITTAQQKTAQLKTELTNQLQQVKDRWHELNMEHASGVLNTISKNSYPALVKSAEPVAATQTIPAMPVTTVVPSDQSNDLDVDTADGKISAIFNLVKQRVQEKPIFAVAIVLLILFALILIYSARKIDSKPEKQSLGEEVFSESSEADEKPMSEEPTKKPAPPAEKKQPSYNYLSGEDVVTSKLDLGKALIEMGNFTHAQEVLESVMKEGDEHQRAEAEKLLKKLS